VILVSKYVRKLVLGIALSAFGSGHALADQIDGTWCKPNSNDRMHIDGANVITPGGNKVIARYSRHSIEYDVPDGETPRDGQIHARQLDGQRIDVARIRKVQIEPPAHDIWTRCEAIS